MTWSHSAFYCRSWLDYDANALRHLASVSGRDTLQVALRPRSSLDVRSACRGHNYVGGFTAWPTSRQQDDSHYLEDADSRVRLAGIISFYRHAHYDHHSGKLLLLSVRRTAGSSVVGKGLQRHRSFNTYSCQSVEILSTFSRILKLNCLTVNVNTGPCLCQDFDRQTVRYFRLAMKIIFRRGSMLKQNLK